MNLYKLEKNRRNKNETGCLYKIYIYNMYTYTHICMLYCVDLFCAKGETWK